MKKPRKETPSHRCTGRRGRKLDQPTSNKEGTQSSGIVSEKAPEVKPPQKRVEPVSNHEVKTRQIIVAFLCVVAGMLIATYPNITGEILIVAGGALVSELAKKTFGGFWG